MTFCFSLSINFFFFLFYLKYTRIIYTDEHTQRTIWLKHLSFLSFFFFFFFLFYFLCEQLNCIPLCMAYVNVTVLLLLFIVIVRYRYIVTVCCSRCFNYVLSCVRKEPNTPVRSSISWFSMGSRTKNIPFQPFQKFDHIFRTIHHFCASSVDFIMTDDSQ